MLTRRILGLVALGLGAIGVLAALILVVGVWVTAGRVQGLVDGLTASANRGVERVSQLLTQVAARTEAIDERVLAVSSQLADPGEPADDPNKDLGTELTRIAVLESASQELQAWASQADQASERLQDVSMALTDFPFPTEKATKSISGLATRLDELSGTLGEAVVDLEELYGVLKTIARAAGMPDEARRSADKLSRATSDRLGAVLARVENVRSRFDEVQSVLQELSDQARKWIREAAALLTFLLIWLGAGQASLLYFGWTSLATQVQRETTQ